MFSLLINCYHFLGFSDWWYLSHTDIHVPSEHTQEGKRYDAEIQMYHFYSVDHDNEMATVTIFMNVYDDAPPFRYLDKLICRWREKEYYVRKQCGLAPIKSTYPGCFPLGKEPDLKESTDDRKLRIEQRQPNNETNSSIIVSSKVEQGNVYSHIKTIADVIYHNHLFNDADEMHLSIDLDEMDLSPPEEKDWDEWIAQLSEEMDEEELRYSRLLEEYNGVHNDELHRKLIEGVETEWFNYWPMLGARTEYYYRYEGTATIPPCYGNDTKASRRGTNHWRVLKDPIRIAESQLKELERLIRDRVAPQDDPVMPCQADTAAKVSEDGIVNVARPLMYTYEDAHRITFCECKDWESKWPEDRAWCLDELEDRLFMKPYNFESDGF